MGLDSHYVLAPSLQEFFIDKDSGLPMSNGQVFFYHDNARSVPKDVFEISGSPPNYSYTVLPNPSTLSAVGTFEDGSGNDILPYYFPFTDSTGTTIDLYYIEVYNSDGVLQFTREGWPNTTTGNAQSDQDVTNFVPNGQFLLHNNIPAVSANNFVPGTITGPLTILGQGGWTFERDSGSTATDIVTFPAYASVQSPSGNPHFACQIQTTIAGSDTRKDLCLKFNGVNTFASATLSYNFYFEAQSIGSTINNVQIIVRKFFGTGGSPSATTETNITTISLGTSIKSYNATIPFGINTNKSLGTNNDDYVQIVIRLPPQGTQTGLFTDFALTNSNETLSAFPTQTEAQQLDISTAGWLPVPNPDGSDLYLPVRLTPSGMQYDHSEIGKICASIYTTAGIGELNCNGSSFLTRNYSSDGIPYSRLQAVLFNSTLGTPAYGTGSAFVTMYGLAAASNYLLFSTNSTGTHTAPAAATSGFTIVTNHVAQSGGGGYGVTAYRYALASILVKDLAIGQVTAPSAGTSGFTVTDGFEGVNRNIIATTYHYFTIVTGNASSLANPGGAGKYFQFFIPGPGNFYIWYQITNETDPAPGGSGIKINLIGTETADDVAVITLSTLNAGGQYTVQTTAASSITQSSYWTFGTANSNSYYVWYDKDGGGTDPKVPGTTLGIEVDIITGDTANQVLTKTRNAINSTYFAVPNFQGLFLRGNDPNSLWDVDSASRFGMFGALYGNNPNTFEIDQFYSHNHSETGALSTVGGVNGAATAPAFASALGTSTAAGGTIPLTIGIDGGTETRPVNAYVNWMIKY